MVFFFGKIITTDLKFKKNVFLAVKRYENIRYYGRVRAQTSISAGNFDGCVNSVNSGFFKFL